MAESDEMSLASVQEPAPTRRPPTRRKLVPFGRSSTLKSGSLQDLKTAHGKQVGGIEVVAGQPADLASRQAGQQQQQQQQGQPDSLAASARPKLTRQRSSQAAGARPQRNPFRSSKSMLLLAQNQHIPQASAQLDCFMTRQQVDFLNYAQLAASSQTRRSRLPAASQPEEQLGLWPQVASQHQAPLNAEGSQQSLKYANYQQPAGEPASAGCNALSKWPTSGSWLAPN